MQYTVPHYYNVFKCIGGRCPDTCCAGWQIAIDDKSLKKYRKVKGPFGNRLRNSIRIQDACFEQYKKRCAFLNEENLCDIYSEAGSDMLCKTCRNYPRHIEEFEGMREVSLSLSCPEAARIIVGCKEKVRLLRKELPGEEEFSEFDCLLFDKLLAAREVIIHILQKRELSLKVRMGMILALGNDLQHRIDRRRVFEIDNLLDRYEKEHAPVWFETRLAEYADRQQSYRMKQKLFKLFDKLEILRESWLQYVKDVKITLFEKGVENYCSAYERFCEDVEQQEDIQIWLEQIAVYFVFTYFCGAVYDGDVFGKIKLAVISVVFLKEMLFAQWIKNDKVPVLKEFLPIVWSYSREIEHSDINTKRLSVMFKGAFFSLENLFFLTM